jgi:hypothetical protein
VSSHIYCFCCAIVCSYKDCFWSPCCTSKFRRWEPGGGGVSGYKYFSTFIICSKTPVVIHTFGEEENSLLALTMDFQVYTILNAAKELHTINFQPNTISVPRPTCIRLKIPSVELTVL